MAVVRSRIIGFLQDLSDIDNLSFNLRDEFDNRKFRESMKDAITYLIVILARKGEDPDKIIGTIFTENLLEGNKSDLRLLCLDLENRLESVESDSLLFDVAKNHVKTLRYAISI